MPAEFRGDIILANELRDSNSSEQDQGEYRNDFIMQNELIDMLDFDGLVSAFGNLKI